MQRATFLGQMGAILVATASSSLLISCGGTVVTPGAVPKPGFDQGLVLLNLQDPSCKQSPTDRKPECDFSGSSIVAARLAGAPGEKDRYTEDIDFAPGYHLLVLPIGTWKLLQLEWTFGTDFGKFNDRRQFVVKHGVVSDWGVIELKRVNARAFSFVREASPPADAQRYLTKNWPKMKTEIRDGLAGPDEFVRE